MFHDSSVKAVFAQLDGGSAEKVYGHALALRHGCNNRGDSIESAQTVGTNNLRKETIP
jgi:hypothetical protein